MTSANRHQVPYGLWMRGADWASVGDGGRPEEVGITQEHDMLRQPATCCYSYTHCRLGFRHRCSAVDDGLRSLFCGSLCFCLGLHDLFLNSFSNCFICGKIDSGIVSRKLCSSVQVYTL